MNKTRSYSKSNKQQDISLSHLTKAKHLSFRKSPTTLINIPHNQSMSESKSFNDLHEKFVAGLHDEDTPVTKDYVKMRLDRLRTLAKASSVN